MGRSNTQKQQNLENQNTQNQNLENQNLENSTGAGEGAVVNSIFKSNTINVKENKYAKVSYEYKLVIDFSTLERDTLLKLAGASLIIAHQGKMRKNWDFFMSSVRGQTLHLKAEDILAHERGQRTTNAEAMISGAITAMKAGIASGALTVDQAIIILVSQGIPEDLVRKHLSD